MLLEDHSELGYAFLIVSESEFFYYAASFVFEAGLADSFMDVYSNIDHGGFLDLL